MIKSLDEFQALGKDGFEAYVASATALTKGMQAMAQEAADYSRRAWEKGSAAVDAVFFGASQQNTDGAARTARQIADQARGGADDRNARAVIDRALPHVPGVQVRREQHDLFGAFAAANFGNDVARLRVLANFGGDIEAYAHGAAAEKIGEHVSIGR